MLTIRFTFVAVLAAAVFTFPPPAAGKLSPKNADKVPLAKEIKGWYYFGDGLGVNCGLELRADGRFEFSWYGCLGEYDRNTGPYHVEKGRVVLFPEKPNIREGFQGTPTRFFPVPWGERLYLVEDERILEFCNAINQGQEPRRKVHGMVYLRRGDEKKPVSGRPVLPKVWRDYLLETPLEGKVIDALGNRGVVNLGKKHGLKVGMVLTDRADENRPYVQLRVTEVMEESAKVETKYASAGETIHVGEPVFSVFLPIALPDE